MKIWHGVNDEMKAAGRVRRGDGPEARDGDDAARRDDVTDGPYAETKEILFSFYVLDVEDLDAALALVAQDAGSTVYGSVQIHATDGARDGVSADSLERAFRDERGAVLATITRRLDGDLALAEDVVQDAFVAAAVEWDRRGVPDRPGAWLTTTAWRKALDRLRHERVVDAHAPELEEPVTYDEIDFEQSSLDDDQLRMLFTCCHPALAPEARMALTLRSVAGLTVPEIARAFISSEAAMERRLTRARNKVIQGADPVQGAERRPAARAARGRAARRLPRVQRGPRGHARRAARGGRAARAAAGAADARRGRGARAARAPAADRRALARPRPRRRARVARGAGPRAVGSRAAIDEGVAVLERALRLPGAGAYSIQAAIAALHDQAPSFAATDWAQIAGLYAELARHRRVAGRDRSTARWRSGSRTARRRAWRCWTRSTGSTATSPLHAARAELLRRLGDVARRRRRLRGGDLALGS